MIRNVGVPVFCGSNGVVTSRAQSSLFTIPGESELFPEVLKDVPGDLSEEFISDVEKFIDMRLASLVVDLDRSIGNFMVDVDGNTFLDLHMHFSSLPFGYNHYQLFTDSDETLMKYAINRCSMGLFPPKEYNNVIEDIMEMISPSEEYSLIPISTGAESVENAIKLSTLYFHYRERGCNDNYSVEDLETCLVNQFPGSSNCAILSFEKGFHGRTLGANSLTRSKPVTKLDIPSFHWPVAPFPQLQYPLESHMEENMEEEERCLEEVREIFESWIVPVVEPIQSDGGDREASKEFFQKLQLLCKEYDSLFILDEIQTGIGITGKMWCYEHFDLPHDPDIICFSKKSQLSGVLYRNELRPELPNRVNSTWHGDMLRCEMFRRILLEIEEKNVLENMKVTGTYLRERLEEVSLESGIIHSVRGRGCFIGFTVHSDRDLFRVKLMNHGVLVNSCGDDGIRLRPSLFFNNNHVDIFIGILEHVLGEM